MSYSCIIFRCKSMWKLHNIYLTWAQKRKEILQTVSAFNMSTLALNYKANVETAFHTQTSLFTNIFQILIF